MTTETAMTNLMPKPEKKVKRISKQLQSLCNRLLTSEDKLIIAERVNLGSSMVNHVINRTKYNPAIKGLLKKMCAEKLAEANLLIQEVENEL